MTAAPPACNTQAELDAEYLAEMGAVVGQEKAEDACAIVWQHSTT